jgi:threonine/homoserine/homoserine lactone efflux protein
MPIASMAAFWMVSILFVITPGADWAYAISAGLRDRVLPAVAGLLTGHLVATAIVAAGVGTALAQLPFALVVLTAAGAAYLVWLGISTLRHPPVAWNGDDAGTLTAPRWYAKGVGVSGLNPKVFLLFIALLPQFTSTSSAWPLSAQLALLGGIHTVTCAVVYLAVGFGARKVLATRPAASRIVSRVSGGAMILIGVVLVGEQVVQAAQTVSALGR